jgi:hypothetical protein
LTDLEMVKNELLEASVEDWCGLWQAHWTVRRMYPHFESSACLELAVKAARELLDGNQVRVAVLTNVGPEAASDGGLSTFRIVDEPLTPEGASAALSDHRNWEPPTDFNVPYMALDATPEGEAAWFALSSGNGP